MKTSPLFVPPPRNNIGRMARLHLTVEEGNRIVYGNVLDLVAGTNQPKRVRIQTGGPFSRQGDVVMPHQYAFLGWADEEEE